MSDRFYRLIFGAVLLVALYAQLAGVLYGLIALLAIEGVTNARVPALVTALRRRLRPSTPVSATCPPAGNYRFAFEAERVWRLIAALLLTVGITEPNTLWFLPWFMGFALLGAGISGVCPMLISVQWLGFR
ncbi:MAG: hypothetical protein ACYCXG_05610 [Acidiferrobacter sp.]